MNTVQINRDQLFEASRSLKGISNLVTDGIGSNWGNSRLETFTRVSGLDQLGREHAGVLVSGPGSARGVAQGLGRIVEGLACGLGATVEGFSLQEDVFTHRLTTLDNASDTTDPSGAVSGVVSGGVGVSVPDSITPVPVVVGPKSVVPPPSVVGLLRDYFTTQTAAIGQASTSWEALSTTMQDVAGRLRGVANDIQAANRGEVIDAVVDRIRATSGVAGSFADNAQAMGVWASRMGWTHKLGVAEAAMMNATVMANMVPGVRQVQERLALAAYARFAMPPLLSLAEPRVGSLIDSSVPPATGGLLEAELEETASLSQEALKDHIDRIREGKPDRVLVEDVHRMQEAATHGAENLASGGVAPVGGVVSGGDASTRTQGVPQVSSPPVGGAGGGVPGAAGTGAAVSGGVPVGGGGGVGRGGAVPVAAGASGVGSSAGASRRGGGSGSRVRPASLVPTTPTTSGGGRGGSSRVGAGSRRRAAGVGAGFGVGAGVGAGLLAAGGAGAGAGVGSGAVGAVPGAVTNAAGGGAGRAGGSRVGAGRGVMPWGMAPAGGREKKSRNIKTVLPELEQDANTRAIVGDAPPMVPGPIGAWAKSGHASLR